MEIVKPTLVVLAAGMGSRYGGLKQMDTFGPNGEAIIDYSIYDAIEAGFGKVVFIVRESFLHKFKEVFDAKLANKIEVSYVTQELDVLPAGLTYHEERVKPWGTAHALWVAKDLIDGPFGVVNADDFYGRDSYKQLAHYLMEDTSNNYCIVAYYLKNTLSDHGHVNRGVCEADVDGNLVDIVECTQIARQSDQLVAYPDSEGNLVPLSEDAIVSMNMMGFKPSYFEYCESQLVTFIKEYGMELKSEFYIPTLLDSLIKSGVLKVQILNTTSSWFGVTYPDDKPKVMEALSALIEAGAYPKNLWA